MEQEKRYLGLAYDVVDLTEEEKVRIGNNLPRIGYFVSHVTEVRRFKNGDYMICRDDYGALPVFVAFVDYPLLEKEDIMKPNTRPLTEDECNMVFRAYEEYLNVLDILSKNEEIHTEQRSILRRAGRNPHELIKLH